jgi:hypothetical protein
MHITFFFGDTENQSRHFVLIFTMNLTAKLSIKLIFWVTLSPKIRVKSPIFKLILIIYPIFFQIQK